MEQIWQRILKVIGHPAVVLVLMAATILATWFLDVAILKVVVSVLGLLAGASVARSFYATNQVKKALKEVQENRDRAWSPQLENEQILLREALGRSDVSSGTDVLLRDQDEVAPSTFDRTLYVRGIQLTNIRCFDDFGISFENETGPFLTTILLGDNAAGKSTLLRSIALGLCSESDAVSLIKTMPGHILRDGTTQGSIVIHLRSYDRKFEGSIHTIIERSGSEGQDIIRQKTYPVDFPWKDIFVCGYGTQRTSGRPSSHENYSPRFSVATLFSDNSDLLNPEIVLLRRDEKTRLKLGAMLKEILLLQGVNKAIHSSARGIELEGPWGSQPLSAVSDGYRSTSQWVLDYLGWQMFADRLNKGPINGILLVDELEQHLHPRWQRYFVQRIRAQFDQTQLITSSHTPLIAAGVADVKNSQVVRLIPTADRAVHLEKISVDELTGKRADQILADAFGISSSKSPGSLSKIDRYTELLSRTRNADEEREFEQLKKEFEDSWSTGDSRLKRATDEAVSKVLDEMLGQAQNLDLPVKQRLLNLFNSENK